MEKEEMIRLKKVLIRIVPLILIFSVVNIVWAGPPPSPSDFYPEIYLIRPDKGCVWFLGRPKGWPSGYADYIFKYDKEKNQWETIRRVDGELLGRIYDVKIYSKKVLFLLDNEEEIYDKINRKWSLRKVNNQEYFRDYNALRKIDKISMDRMTKHEIDKRSIIKEGYKYLLLGDRILKLKEDQVIAIFYLPQSTSEYLIQMRPRVERWYREGDPIKNSIGPFFIKDDKIWFGITFYDSEGWWGLGGIGFFDTKEEKWGLLHSKILKDSSVDCILSDGSRIWVGISHHGEYGFYPTFGLVVFDRVNGNYRYFTTKNSNISGDLISFITRDGNEVWIATEYGISRYNTQSKEWLNYSADCVVIDSDGVAVFPGIEDKALGIKSVYQPKGFLKKGDNYKLLWYCSWEDYDAQAKRWFFRSFYEVESPFKTIGWVRKEAFERLNKLYRKREWEEFDIYATIYSDDFKSPIGYVAAANLEKIEEKDGMVKISTAVGWIDGNYAYPVFSEIKGQIKTEESKGDHYKIKYNNLEQDMLQTAEMLISEELADYTEVIIDRDYIVDEENLSYEIFNIDDNGPLFRVRISANLNTLSGYNPIEGAKKGVFSCTVWIGNKRLDLSATDKDFWGFESNELGLQKISNGMEIVEKSESNNYKVLVTVIDYKTGKTKLGKECNFRTGYVLEWVKFHVEITKRK